MRRLALIVLLFVPGFAAAGESKVGGRTSPDGRAAIRSGRMPCVTYGYSPRYVGPPNPGGRIAHMVDCVHYSAAWVAVLDNNFPGDDQYEWMKPDEFQRRWMLGNPNGGWVVLP